MQTHVFCFVEIVWLFFILLILIDFFFINNYDALIALDKPTLKQKYNMLVIIRRLQLHKIRHFPSTINY